MFAFLILAFVFIASTFEELRSEKPECVITDIFTFYSYDDLVNCVKGAELTKTILDSLHNAFQANAAIYVFGDIAKNPPSPYNESCKVDILQEEDDLYQKISEELTTNSDNDDYYFPAYKYEDGIIEILEKLRDGHVSFVKTPMFYGSTVVCTPVFFTIENKDHVKFSIELARMYDPNMLGPEFIQSYNEKFADSLVNLPNKSILDIIGLEIIKINNKDPFTAIQEYADDIVPTTKSTHSRFNTLSQYMSQRTLYTTSLTKEGKYKVLKLRLKKADDTEIDVDLNLGVFTMDPTPFENVKESYAAEYCDIFSPEEKLYYKCDQLLLKTRSSIASLLLEQYKKNPLKLRKTIKEFVFSHFNVQSNEQIVKKENEMFMKVDGDKRGSFVLYKLNNADPKAIEILSYRSEDDIKRDGKSPSIYALNIIDFSVFDKNAYDSAFFTMKNDNVKYLIISVVGNTGGDITIPPFLMHYLFSSAYPLSSQYSIRKNNVSKAVLKLSDTYFGEKNRDFIDFLSGKILDGMTWYDNTPEEINGQSGLFSQAIDTNYIGEFASLDLSPDHIAIVSDASGGSTTAVFSKQFGEQKLAMLFGLGGNPNYMPTKYTNVTPPKFEDRFDVASYSGGLASNSSSFEMEVDNFTELTEDDIKNGITLEEKKVIIKAKLSDDVLFDALFTYPRFPGNCVMGYPIMQIYSFEYNYGEHNTFLDNKDRLRRPLEYHPVDVHDVINVWLNESNLTDINMYASKVLERMIGLRSSNATIFAASTNLRNNLEKSGIPFGDVYANEAYDQETHAYYGKSIENNKVFAHCEPGYYLSEYNLNNGLDIYDNKHCFPRSDPYAYYNHFREEFEQKIDFLEDGIFQLCEENQDLARKLFDKANLLNNAQNGIIALSVVLAIFIVLTIVFLILYIIKLKSFKKKLKIVNEKGGNGTDQKFYGPA